MPNDIQAWAGIMAVETARYNDLLVYKVKKPSGIVIDQKWYNRLEIRTNGYLNIYTYGNVATPEIDISLQDYANADYYYVFWIKNVA